MDILLIIVGASIVLYLFYTDNINYFYIKFNAVMLLIYLLVDWAGIL